MLPVKNANEFYASRPSRTRLGFPARPQVAAKGAKYVPFKTERDRLTWFGVAVGVAVVFGAPPEWSPRVVRELYLRRSEGVRTDW